MVFVSRNLYMKGSSIYNKAAPLVMNICHYSTTPNFFWVWSIGAKSRKVGDIYKFIVDWVAKPWLLHKDDSCIVVQPTQKETTQVVNFIQQRPGIQWDQWRNGELA